MQRASYELSILANVASGLLVFIAGSEQVLLPFTANKCALGSCFYFVNLEMIKSFNVLDKVIVLLSFCWSASKVMSIIIFSTKSKYLILT